MVLPDEFVALREPLLDRLSLRLPAQSLGFEIPGLLLEFQHQVDPAHAAHALHRLVGDFRNKLVVDRPRRPPSTWSSQPSFTGNTIYTGRVVMHRMLAASMCPVICYRVYRHSPAST